MAQTTRAPTLKAIRADLRKHASQQKAENSAWFFKTGPGDYGHGDRFLGVKVPDVRKLSRLYRELSASAIERLLCSPWHEERQVALFILVLQFESGGEHERQAVFDLYCKRMDRVNNWDLVDGSAPQIVGGQLSDRPRDQLYIWANSSDLWERRIAMLACLSFIKQRDFRDALSIADILVEDEHDLIQKAVGWMLREVGNRDQKAEVKWLNPRYQRMPRTMLRYAIEKFPERLRQDYLKGRVSRARK